MADDINVIIEEVSSDINIAINEETSDININIDNNYTLPIASSTMLGGIKVGNGLSMSGEFLSSDAQVQMQADLQQTDNLQPDFVKGKEIIPVELSDLSDDSTHRLVTDTEKTTWNNKLSVETDPIFVASQAHNITSTHITVLNNTSGVNTGDQDLSGYAAKKIITDLIKVDGYATALTLNGVSKTVVRDSDGIITEII